MPHATNKHCPKQTSHLLFKKEKFMGHFPFSHIKAPVVKFESFVLFAPFVIVCALAPAGLGSETSHHKATLHLCWFKGYSLFDDNLQLLIGKKGKRHVIKGKLRFLHIVHRKQPLRDNVL